MIQVVIDHDSQRTKEKNDGDCELLDVLCILNLGSLKVC